VVGREVKRLGAAAAAASIGGEEDRERVRGRQELPLWKPFSQRCNTTPVEILVKNDKRKCSVLFS
jgi:hypothetical protein